MSVNVIQPNCRVQFTAEDIEFILSTLGSKAGVVETLTKLLADEDTRDLILDDESLFRALLEQRGCLRVSSHFYFYILVRQVFKRCGIQDRTVADYVAEVLAEFAHAERNGLPYHRLGQARRTVQDQGNGHSVLESGKTVKIERCQQSPN